MGARGPAPSEARTVADLGEWLRGVVAKGAVRVELRVMVRGSDDGTPVDELAGEDMSAEAIYGAAVSHAQGRGGTQRYAAIAFGEGKRPELGRHGIGVDAEAATPPPIETSQAASVVSSTRAATDAWGVALRASEAGARSSAKLIDQLTTALEHTRGENVRLWEVVRDYQALDVARKKEEAEERTKERRENFLLDSAKLAAPGLIARFLPSAEVREEGLARFVESLTEPQRNGLFAWAAANLSQDQLHLLDAVLGNLEKKRAAEAAAKSAAAGAERAAAS